MTCTVLMAFPYVPPLEEAHSTLQDLFALPHLLLSDSATAT